MRDLDVFVLALGRLILKLIVISAMYFHFKTSLCLNVPVQLHRVSVTGSHEMWHERVSLHASCKTLLAIQSVSKSVILIITPFVNGDGL